MASAVNVMDLVDSRSLEITAAMEAMMTNSAISHKLSIPFYMRRRAASHNPRRLPARVRPHDATKSATKCKWKQRRTKTVCQNKAVRLETHLWHAKRCHMSDLWGYRLATTTTQKGQRATYRAINQATTLHDSSCYHWFSLSAPNLDKQLATYLFPNHKAFNRVLSSHLYYQGLCLGPVSVFWISDATVFIRTHPAISHHTDLATVFRELCYTSYRDKFSQFTLDGVKSVELLVKSLTLSEGTCEVVRKLWRALQENPFLYDVMRGTVIGGRVVVPPAQFKPFRAVVNSVVSQPARRLVPGRELCGDVLFRTGELGGDVVFRTGECPAAPADTLPCCIYKDPYTASLTVIIPRGTGTRLWVPLVYNGGRVIGLEDKRSILTEQNIPVFPNDYPDTAAGKTYLAKLGEEVEAKELRRPPQKRVRYTELGITSPFVSDWRTVCQTDNISVIRDPIVLNNIESLSAEYSNYLVTVTVSCVKRGHVTPGARLYYTSNVASTDPAYSEEDSYPLVGYVTSGRYCLSAGRGAGIGLVLCSAYKMSVKGTLLVRNTTTKQYRYVRVEPIR